MPSHCVCSLHPVPTAQGVPADGRYRPLKPSNTGWLIADVVPDTLPLAGPVPRFIPDLLALLADPQWQPLRRVPRRIRGARAGGD